MSKHPLNLALRFILEVAALISFGIWGYGISDSPTRIVTAILFPVLFALIWGIFAVRNDPSRSGKTVVPTPGIIRLILELALFGSAVWMLLDMQYTMVTLIFGIAVGGHYILSYDRIIWLFKQK